MDIVPVLHPYGSSLGLNDMGGNNSLVDNNGIDVYLKSEKEGTTFHFPLNPLDEITIRSHKNYQTYDLNEIGEVDFHKNGEKIKELSFKVLIPDDYTEGFNRYGDVIPPAECIATLERYMKQKEALRLIITKLPYNDLVFLSNLDPSMKAGLEGCRFANLKFRSHRDIKVKTVDTTKNKVNKGLNKTDRSNTKTGYSTHKIKYGDCLWNIAKKNLGKGSRWTEIQALNKDVIKNPNKIPLGTVIKIPKR
ncbi:LysM peptidoglycan-binding domain-containing protein [Peptostreptococcus anaerobius]